MHELFGLPNVFGLTDVLRGQRDIQEAWKEPVDKLKVVPVGLQLSNPAEISGLGRYLEFVCDSVRGKADYVLVDAPPIAVASDSLVLGPQADGVLLVLDARRTQKEAVRQSIRSLETAGAKVLGTVMTNAEAFQANYYYES